MNRINLLFCVTFFFLLGPSVTFGSFVLGPNACSVGPPFSVLVLSLVLPPSLVIGLWFRVPLVERFVHPRLNGSFNSSTERLVGGKLLKQFSYQVSVCLLSDGIGEGDFVKLKAAVIFVGKVARSLQLEKTAVWYQHCSIRAEQSARWRASRERGELEGEEPSHTATTTRSRHKFSLP